MDSPLAMCTSALSVRTELAVVNMIFLLVTYLGSMWLLLAGKCESCILFCVMRWIDESSVTHLGVYVSSLRYRCAWSLRQINPPVRYSKGEVQNFVSIRDLCVRIRDVPEASGIYYDLVFPGYLIPRGILVGPGRWRAYGSCMKKGWGSKYFYKKSPFGDFHYFAFAV